MERKKYEFPPIKEVICEFRFSQSSQWDPTVPGLIFEQLREEFPIRDKGKDIETELVFDGTDIQPKVKLTERAIFKNTNENVIIQIGAHHLSINHIKPYTGWEIFSEYISKAFEAYKIIAEPTSIDRIELRYINEIDFSHIDHPTIKLEEYFDFYPYVGESDPSYNSFIAGIQSTFDSDVQKREMTSNGPNIILDINYFTGSPNSVKIENVYEWLEKAHTHNITAFESSIKSQIRSVFRKVDY